MSLQKVKEQVFNLSISDRLTLVNLIVESLQGKLNHQAEVIEQSSAGIPTSYMREHLSVERTALIKRMRGFLKTDKPAPTDSEVQTVLEEQLLEKYLQ